MVKVGVGQGQRPHTLCWEEGRSVRIIVVCMRIALSVHCTLFSALYSY